MNTLLNFSSNWRKAAKKSSYLSVLLLALWGQAHAALTPEQHNQFAKVYEPELGQPIGCEVSEGRNDRKRFCYRALKNDGNAPVIFEVDNPKARVVLFHGLSDSPFFMRSIAENLQREGYDVILPLTPGHGKKDADSDMQDSELKTRWYTHTNAVMDIVTQDDIPVWVGGFSTGGAFATWYALHNEMEVEGILLFSGALQLSSSAEAMHNIWGMKLLAKWLDGKYQSTGPNPYKYPSVASFSGLILMDIIDDIRDKLDATSVSMPIFSAHSLADNVTLFEGIEYVTSRVEGEHTIFKIDESYEVCHADIVMDPIQIIDIKFDKTLVDERERCAVPQANPLHRQMLQTLNHFLTTRTR